MDFRLVGRTAHDGLRAKDGQAAERLVISDPLFFLIVAVELAVYRCMYRLKPGLRQKKTLYADE